ncbi:O-antigen ligase family protein [Frateuria aurantia]|uniref:Lipid A core-O-antigen ligase-like enyme n=1 Tax=Frateuria aurantia (strain ATCC 33424 / DSM 6220 / KCTC 2777 / LMG 1558 / NBRC 3245 / NCIMB 13370) TaxID=767434 RepID=H8L4D8_FRAAD|nr:O-antigen ligase family protein [Frateuria aurantia]AFC84971.1 lipid A core-O-antigen ligase-like enyme [Frateuria aurantia DSM 6220]
MLSSTLRAALRSPLLPCWLIPALLPWGRSAEIGTLLCAAGAVWLWRRRPAQAEPAARLWLGLCGAYLLAAVLSVPLSLHPGRTALVCLGLLRYLPLGLYIGWVLATVGRLHALYTATALLVLVWCLDAWLQMACGWSLGGAAEADRITGIFGAGNLKLGPVLAALAPFVLWLGQRVWGWRGMLAGWLLVAGPVVLSGARSAWIVLALVGLLFCWRAVRSWRHMASVLILAGGLAAVFAAVGWQVSPRFHARAERSLQLLDGSRQGLDTALTGRVEIWSTAARMVAAHPWTGVGVREFRHAYPAYAAADDRFVGIERCGPGQGACHPHQWMLEVLTETGLLGALCWLAAVALAWRCWRQRPPPRRGLAFPATVAVVAVWFPGNTHLAFYSAWWGLLSAWLLAVWCASLYVTGPGDDDGDV